METPEMIAANRAFAEARNLAEGKKQAAIRLAMAQPMPQHLIQIRKAERDFHLALAAAADASGGIIASAPYHQATAD